MANYLFPDVFWTNSPPKFEQNRWLQVISVKKLHGIAQVSNCGISEIWSTVKLLQTMRNCFTWCLNIKLWNFYNTFTYIDKINIFQKLWIRQNLEIILFISESKKFKTIFNPIFLVQKITIWSESEKVDRYFLVQNYKLQSTALFFRSVHWLSAILPIPNFNQSISFANVKSGTI